MLNVSLTAPSKYSSICRISGIASRPHGTLIPLIFYDEDDFFEGSSIALFNILVLVPKRQKLAPFKSITYQPNSPPGRG